MLTLETELSIIKGVNKRLALGLAKLGIKTVQELLLHLPFRYDDFSEGASIIDLSVGQTVTVRGTVRAINMRHAFRRNMTIVEATIEDETGTIRAVWFNQPYLMRALQVGTSGNFAGKVAAQNGTPYLSNPVYEASEEKPTHTAGLVPIYPETKGVTSRGIRYLVQPLLTSLGTIPDCLPQEILKSTKLPSLTWSLNAVHFPTKLEDAERARRRLAFEDLFMLQLAHLEAKMHLAKEPAHAIPWTDAERDEIIGTLPFTPTGAQMRSILEMLEDMKEPHPMNRLLQGDVGSGKTIVAAMGALLTARHGFQTAILAPTEVLARQHYKTIVKLFGPLLDAWRISVALLTSSESRMAYGDDLETGIPKSRLMERIAGGQASIVIGTHALLQKGVEFADLALVAVDEQHRFGVKQRAALSKTHGGKVVLPHFLSMSATPIPRTLSLAIFGDLDLSIIDELPLGRKPIITKIVPKTGRAKAYAFMRQEMQKGRQIFVICPRIEESTNTEDGMETLWTDAKAATKEYEKLSKEIFPDFKVGMLHGKMKPVEKAETMRRFSECELNILVATSVIEVGVDIPNATIMVIEDADRFGLAQLYQFRGRVGRSDHQSVCLLFSENRSAISSERLKALLAAKNGFELAEQDLALRGPGQFLGQSQTGMPDAMMRSLTDITLMKSARHAAEETLKADPALKKNPLLSARLSRFKKAVHLE